MHQPVNYKYLRDLLQKGLDAAERGERFEFTPELMRKIREESRTLAFSGDPLDPDVCGQVHHPHSARTTEHN